MFKFAHPIVLYALLLVPVMILLYILWRRLKKQALKKFGDIHLLQQLMPEVSKNRPFYKFTILMFAYIALILGIAGPLVGSKLEQVKHKGAEIIIALDVSNSMMAEDIQPNRLERAKQAISKLVDKLQNDKIGLIVFAGDAYVQLPITTDYASAKMFLNAITPKSVPIQGTAIGKAIEMAMRSFTPEADKNKAIIIITDGENHEDDAMKAASEASAKGIVVHTIGMGLPQGAPIPVIGRYGQRDFKTDRSGQVVVSKLDETMLQQIASSGNGVYIRASNTSVGLNTLLDEINKLEKKEYESENYSDYEDRFQYFLGIALLLILFDFLILERKNKLFRNINLFKINS